MNEAQTSPEPFRPEMRDPVAWKEAWERSLKIQRAVHEALRALETRLRQADQVSDTEASK